MTKNDNEARDAFETRLVASREASGPLSPPIVLASTFAFESASALRRYLTEGEASGHFFYTRYGNPTNRELEERLSEMEGAEEAIVFSSGMAAVATALLSILAPGDHVLYPAASYGGTHRLLRDLLGRFGVVGEPVPSAELVHACENAGPRTRAVWFESPTNPQLQVIDIRAVADAARAKGMLSFFDNTFASPALQQPLRLGVDIVMHSLTKSIAGHSDVTGGALLGSHKLIATIRSAAKLLGGVMDPHAAFLTLRGLRTLALRAERSSANALSIARALRSHDALSRVIYPGLEEHPEHLVAKKQMSAFGSQLTIELKKGLSGAERVYDRVRLVRRAVSLGGVESLVSLPCLSSHAGLSAHELRAADVSEGMLRFSIGIERASDIEADIKSALAG